ncbi:hypothetical protein J5N97_029361 [Dioscorea zingiberensis]|uniref:B box-type domain-containing protein n=1 Tax=Dioscorea zingiberensis TaxID=325984 RepID=A0A9D5C197_9LILI|nr:hypothetical protein J5N97_029361 [Dioscorea zingiberensis]
MKIQCDVCGREAATLFCCADEAALCSSCDRRVHKANKLAGKHRRLSLLSPSPPPLCDVCQEKRAFIFCQEDRAILCQDCDAPIHAANDLTKNHSRFLLAGVRLSSDEPEKHQNFSSPSTITTTTNNSNNSNSSSISDYLIKTLPGWRVEDLLVDDAAEAAAAHTLSQMEEHQLFSEPNIADELPGWAAPHVPQAPPISFSSSAAVAATKQVISNHSKRWTNDEPFRVPQLPPAISGGHNKRPRTNSNMPSPPPSPSSSPWYY